jgi:hypothetical protein
MRIVGHRVSSIQNGKKFVTAEELLGTDAIQFQLKRIQDLAFSERIGVGKSCHFRDAWFQLNDHMTYTSSRWRMRRNSLAQNGFLPKNGIDH